VARRGLRRQPHRCGARGECRRGNLDAVASRQAGSAPDQAAAALDRLSRRENFTDPGELVFCGQLGRTLDASALRRRYRKAKAPAGLAPLRWHDLRHSSGSLLAAAGVDLVKIKSAMGHSNIATTERYLHARPASEQAAEFTAAFAAGEVTVDSLALDAARRS